jgi:hypothetical protein
VAISGGPALPGDGKQERWPPPTRPSPRLRCPFFRLELHELASISGIRHGDDDPGSRGPAAEVECTVSPPWPAARKRGTARSPRPLSLPCSSSGAKERRGGRTRMVTVDPLPPRATGAVCSLSSSALAHASAPPLHLIGAPLFPLVRLLVDLVAGDFGDGS